MALNGYEKISLLLKFPASIYGIISILWGIMLTIGYGPDGPHKSLQVHLLGLLYLIHGISFVIPNSKATGNTALSSIYLVVISLPCLIPIIITFQIILSSGTGYSFELTQIKINAVWLCLLVTAPSSLLFSIIGARRKIKEAGKLA